MSKRNTKKSCSRFDMYYYRSKMNRTDLLKYIASREADIAAARHILKGLDAPTQEVSLGKLASTDRPTSPGLEKSVAESVEDAIASGIGQFTLSQLLDLVNKNRKKMATRGAVAQAVLRLVERNLVRTVQIGQGRRTAVYEKI